MFDALVYQVQYTILTLIAAFFWIINQALLFMAALCYEIKQAIIDVTAPDPQHAGFVLQVLDRMLRDASANSIQQLVYLSLGLAVILFFGTMLLRPLFVVHVVDPKRAFLWLFAATMLFTLGSGFFLSLEQLRESLREMAQTVVLQSGLTTTNPDPTTIHTGMPNQMGDQHHYFNTFIPCQSGPGQPCNGLDLAMSYLYITQETEVTQFNGGDALHQYLPRHFCERNDAGVNDPQVPLQAGYAGYFYWDMAQGDLSDNTRRQQAVNDAGQGVLRMLTGIPISLFALLEAVIYLVFTLSAAILFFSIPIALVFAFFQPTEVIVVSVMQAYLTLFVKTYAAASILTLIFTFLLYWASQGNAGAFMTVTLVMLTFSWQFVGMAWQTLSGSFSMVTDNLHRAVGTRPSPLSTAPIPTITPEGRLQLQGGFAGLRATRGALAVMRGPMAPRGEGAGRPLVGIEADRDPDRGELVPAVAAAAVGGVLGAVAGAGLAGRGRTPAARPDEAAVPTARPPGRWRDGATAPVSPDGAHALAAPTPLAPAPLRGEATGWWRNDERGVQAGDLTAQALAVPERAAQRQVLERLALGPRDQDRVAAALAGDPPTAQAVLQAADALFEDPQRAHLTYLDADGQIALGSPGMRALTGQLQEDLPVETVRRLTEEPAGQEQLGTLVGVRGGFERQWSLPELADQISAAAAAPDASLAALTRQMEIAPSTFGGASPALDHLIRELRDLGVTEPETVRDLVQGAHRMRAENPQTAFGAAARQHFASEQGSDSTMAWSFIRVQEAAADRARTTGEDPARAEQAVARLFRDTLAVPPQMFTPTLPRLGVPTGAPLDEPERLPVESSARAQQRRGVSLAPEAAPSGNGPVPGLDGALAVGGERPRRTRAAASGGPAPHSPGAAGARTAPTRGQALTAEASGPPAGGRRTTPLDGLAGPDVVLRVGGAPSRPVVPGTAQDAGTDGESATSTARPLAEVVPDLTPTSGGNATGGGPANPPAPVTRADHDPVQAGGAFAPQPADAPAVRVVGDPPPLADAPTARGSRRRSRADRGGSSGGPPPVASRSAPIRHAPTEPTPSAADPVVPPRPVGDADSVMDPAGRAVPEALPLLPPDRGARQESGVPAADRDPPSPLAEQRAVNNDLFTRPPIEGGSS